MVGSIMWVLLEIYFSYQQWKNCRVARLLTQPARLGQESCNSAPIDVKVCTMVDLSSGHKVSLFGGNIFRGHQMWGQKGRGVSFWASKKLFDCKYRKNGKSVN